MDSLWILPHVQVGRIMKGASLELVTGQRGLIPVVLMGKWYTENSSGLLQTTKRVFSSS